MCNGTGKVTKRKRIVTNTGGSHTDYKQETCPQCRGKGTITCPDCHGLGGRKMKCKECGGRGHTLEECPVCHGEAYKVCPECRGTGLKDPTREVNVEDLIM
jgi:DnaJ-class molecular chaperone